MPFRLPSKSESFVRDRSRSEPFTPRLIVSKKKGFVASELSEPTPERGGRPKRFYRIQAPGLHALSEAYAADRRRWSAFPPIGAPV